MDVLPKIFLQSDWDKIEVWLKANGTDILIIIGVAIAARLAWNAFFPPLARTAIISGAHPPDAEMERRADTIIGVVNSVFTLVLALLVIVTVLTEFGVDVTAIIAGLGIMGLALAMGAQQFVKDAINGGFLLAEDQYRVGDTVTIADTTGTVEAVTLRRTVIRDTDGIVHSVPNGSITVVSNHTRDFAIVNVTFRVGLRQDLDAAGELILKAARSAGEVPEFASLVLDSPSILGVTEVDDSAATITVCVRTTPGSRSQVAREVRKRVITELIRAGFTVAQAGDATAP
jgi:small conductance mechanosensitive channel